MAFAATFALALACCAVGYLLLKQQGRLLIRLECIEQELVVWRLQDRRSGVSDATSDSTEFIDPVDPEGRNDISSSLVDPLAFTSHINRSGLSLGTVAPDFTLDDLNGSRESLSAYRGKTVLLVFGSADCSPCDQLMADLSGQVRQAAARDELSNYSPLLTHSAVLFVSRGSAQEIKDKIARANAPFSVLRQEAWEVSRQYGTFKFPVAYLVNPQGVISDGPRFGRDAIQTLATRLYRPTAEVDTAQQSPTAHASTH